MKIKTHHSKLPRSIYVVFGMTVIANIVATVVIIKYFL